MMKRIWLVSTVATLVLFLLVVQLLPSDGILVQAKSLIKDESYQQAIALLDGQEVDPLIKGNLQYFLGVQRSDSDPENANAAYQEALLAYMEGMKDEPARMDLKFNYEYVSNQMNQQNDSQDQQDSKDDQSDQEQKNQEGQQDSSDEQSGQDQQNESDQQDASENQSSQNEDNQDQENQENQQETSNDQSSQDQDNQEQQNQSDQQGSESDQKGHDQEEQQISDQDTYDMDEAMLNQILQMLEDQESESLKNNQAIIDQGQEDETHDW